MSTSLLLATFDTVRKHLDDDKLVIRAIISYAGCRVLLIARDDDATLALESTIPTYGEHSMDLYQLSDEEVNGLVAAWEILVPGDGVIAVVANSSFDEKASTPAVMLPFLLALSHLNGALWQCTDSADQEIARLSRVMAINLTAQLDGLKQSWKPQN